MRSHGSSLWGFRDKILQGWFKTKTTSIFPVHTTCSLKFDFEMRRHISILKRGYIVLYMDILQKQIVSI